MNLLTTLAVHQENAAQAEKLLDWIYQLSGRVTSGHIVLACHGGIHAEMRARLKISAQVAYEGVHELEIRAIADTIPHKNTIVNSTFRQIAEHVEQNFTWPFLYLEPDCVPVEFQWNARLLAAYEDQPKPFLGRQMKAMPKVGDPKPFMQRIGVYPNNTATRILTEFSVPFTTKVPFEILTGDYVAPRMTNTTLIQPFVISAEADLEKVDPSAVLIHGDKVGLLLKKCVEKSKPLQVEPPTNSTNGTATYHQVNHENGEMEAAVVIAPKRRGRPPKVKLQTV